MNETELSPQAAQQQIVEADLDKAIGDVTAHGLDRRHQRLLTLLHKLRGELYGPGACEAKGSQSARALQQTTVADKVWI